MKRIRDKYWLIIGAISVMVASLTHFPELAALFNFQERQTLFPGLHPADVINEMLFTCLSLILIFWLNQILFGFNKDTTHIGTFKIIASFVFTWIISNLLGKCFVFLHLHFNIPAIDAMLHHYLHPLRDSLIASVVTGSSYLMYISWKNQKIQLENQQLQAEIFQSQYETLKNQLNPHMLFNSLNTLNTLIRETPEKAQNYLQELSHVLRYTLQDNQTHCVTLQEEMLFVNSYIYLLQMRYEDNLTFIVQLSQEDLHRQLPPMAIQLLIENAIKHNEISNRNPLTITISSKGNKIEVKNRIQPKLTDSHGTGIGLSNLSKRYQLLFGQDIEVQEQNGYFIVNLPLA